MWVISECAQLPHSIILSCGIVIAKLPWETIKMLENSGVGVMDLVAAPSRTKSYFVTAMMRSLPHPNDR